MTQVADALMPILCSIEPQATPLRAPGEPSPLGTNFGHQEQADALGARRRVRQSREHEVDDVLGQVVLAGAR